MASVFIPNMSVGFSSSSHSRRRNIIAGSKKQSSFTQPIIRRSGNYPPSKWSHDFVKSLDDNHKGESYKKIQQNLKERVRRMIFQDILIENPLSTLKFVDDFQRLGVSYHFKNEISNVLKKVYSCHFEAHKNWNELDLNVKALGYRLLRQHGYHIPQEIFEDIMDETGKIKANIEEDVVGMLNLYDASFFAIDDENIMDEAREFMRKCLKEKLENKDIVDETMMMLISHSLDHPLHWRIPRFESTWFIEVYNRRSDMIPLLYEFAVLDYDIVQQIHQEDLKHTSEWWVDLQWIKNVEFEFARDSMLEGFTWSVAVNHEPPFSVLRINIAKIISIASVLDDIYDVYGTLDELEQFTEVVRRWDINAAEGLPHYMKLCFFGLYNTVNDMAYNTLINHKSFVVPYLKKVWIELCEALLMEARWFHNGYIPTFKEYLEKATISVAIPHIVLATYFLDSNDFVGEALHNVIHWSSIILRITDDLAPSEAELARDDVTKSVECYMHETGASRDEAVEHMRRLIIDAHKKINKERMTCKSLTLLKFMEYATNLGRIGHITYDRGDMFGAPDDIHKSHYKSLLFEPKS